MMATSHRYILYGAKFSTVEGVEKSLWQETTALIRMMLLPFVFLQPRYRCKPRKHHIAKPRYIEPQLTIDVSAIGDTIHVLNER